MQFHNLYGLLFIAAPYGLQQFLMVLNYLMVLNRCHGQAANPVIVNRQSLAHLIGKLLTADGKQLPVHLIVQLQKLLG